MAQLNQGSKSNGCLMRITPLAVWGHRLSTDQLVAATQEDCRLTNPNQSCQVQLLRQIIPRQISF